MKRKLLFLLLLFSFSLVKSQEALKPINKENLLLITKALNEQVKKGYNNSDLSNWKVQSDASSRAKDTWYYYLVQNYNDIEVRNALVNLSLHSNDAKVNYIQFVKNISEKVNTISPSITAKNAIMEALNYLKLKNISKIQMLSAEGNKYKFSSGGVVKSEINVQLVYEKINENTLKLAWDVSLDLLGGKHWWNIRIDAVSGNYINKNDWVTTCYFGETHSEHIHHKKENNHFLNDFDFFKSTHKNNITNSFMTGGSYRVLPYYIESPNHGDFQLISSPEDLIASPNGWHDDGTSYTTTRGNNVIARDDQDGDNNTLGPLTSQSSPGLVFDYQYGGPGVSASSYIEAATTNAFYVSNVVHDIYYRYGFDEASGNFQQQNYGNGGSQGDPVDVDVQDGSSFNNANFSTPGDGGNGRMQMFLWNQGAYDPNAGPLFEVNNTSVSGIYPAIDNNFDDPGHILPSVSITSDLVLVSDSIGDSSDGCENLVNTSAISGKIAVIRRGSCSFVSKVVKAQDAGAIAVLIINNVDGDIIMGGTTADGVVTIPAYSLNMSDGEIIISQMAIETVNATLFEPTTPPTFVNIDGDFDNGVIEHELGHGVNIRLVGGRLNSSCVRENESMGEGWADYIGKILLLKNIDNGIATSGTGTFVVGQAPDGVGIRPAPYSGDIENNPMTYETLLADTTNATYTIPHGVGSVWAGILWDLTWDLIAIHGFNPDIYDSNGTEGNIKALNIVVEGMKLTACGPGFEDGRDALLAADAALYGGENTCAIWGAFARRGVGFRASQGNTNSTSDGRADFGNPPTCSENFLMTIGGPTEVCEGTNLNFDLVFNAQNGWNSPVGFTVTGQPSGSIINFSPNTISDTGLVVMNTTNLPVGNHTVTVTPNNDPSKNIVLNLVVNPINPILSDGDTEYSVNGNAYTSFNNAETISVSSGDNLDLSLPTTFSGSLLWTSPNGVTYTGDLVSLTSIIDEDSSVEGTWTVFADFTNECNTSSETITFDIIVTPSLSTNDNSFSNIGVYPNPNNGLVNISSSNNLSNANVSIFDITGRLLTRNIKKNQISNNIIEIDMSVLSSGVYFLMIEDSIYKSTIKVIKE
jgi:hypothetical protein